MINTYTYTACEPPVIPTIALTPPIALFLRGI